MSFHPLRLGVYIFFSPSTSWLGDFSSTNLIVTRLGRACTQVLFQRKAKLEFFHFLEIVTGWLVPSAGQKIPVQPSWYLPPQKTQLAEYRFLQAGKGAENTKEKSRQCFYSLVMPLEWVSSRSKHTSTLPPWASAYFWNALLLGHYPIPAHPTHSKNYLHGGSCDLSWTNSTELPAQIICAIWAKSTH